MNVVITDRRIVSSPAPGVSTWEAVACPPGWMISTSDYYPFGMQMPGRTNSYGAGVDYRYAYNGMETDVEVSGTGNSYTTYYRKYDPRLGRWKSLDPAVNTHLSPYNGFDNNPIMFVDVFGDDIIWGSPGKTNAPSPKDQKYILRKLTFKSKFGSKEVRAMCKAILYGEHDVYITVHPGESFRVTVNITNEAGEIIGDFETDEFTFERTNGVSECWMFTEEFSEKLIELDHLEIQMLWIKEGTSEYAELLNRIVEIKSSLPSSADKYNGKGVDVAIDFTWDEVFYKNTKDNSHRTNIFRYQNKKRLFWHEIRHAYANVSGTVELNKEEEERRATRFENKMLVFGRSRLYYNYYNLKLLYSGKGSKPDKIGDEQIKRNEQFEKEYNERIHKSENEDKG